LRGKSINSRRKNSQCSSGFLKYLTFQKVKRERERERKKSESSKDENKTAHGKKERHKNSIKIVKCDDVLQRAYDKNSTEYVKIHITWCSK
jgi:hypothetical protein